MRAIVSRFTLASAFFLGLTVFCMANEETVEIDPNTGLRMDADENWKLIKSNCSACHSERLLTQQQLDRANWAKAIKRMQTQENLWDLGEYETKILDYLSSFYGASSKPKRQRVRRAQLQPVDFTPLAQSEIQSSEIEEDSSQDDGDSTDSSESQNLDDDESKEN